MGTNFVSLIRRLSPSLAEGKAVLALFSFILLIQTFATQAAPPALTPTVVASPTAGEIVFGQTLSSASITGGLVRNGGEEVRKNN